MLGDTWTFDFITGAWTQVVPAVSPSPRCNHAMFFSIRLNRVILFGGQNDSTIFDDTWSFDGANWTQIATPGPGARTGAKMVEMLQSPPSPSPLILFGGTNGNTAFGDTWSFDGTTWTQLNPANSPSPRSGHCLGFDWFRRRIALFGGSNGATVLGDTWTFDGTDWAIVTAGGSTPAPRFNAGMTWSLGRMRFLMVGGQDSAGISLSDTWEFSALDGQWMQAPTAILPRSGINLAAASGSNGDVVLGFGGFVSTPIISPALTNTLATYTAPSANILDLHGGCVNSSGQAMSLISTLPWRGNVNFMSSSNLPTGAGLYATFISATTVPPGPGPCNLVVPTATAFLVAANSQLALAIPNTAAFEGLSLFAQAATLDPVANNSLVVSNTLLLTIH